MLSPMRRAHAQHNPYQQQLLAGCMCGDGVGGEMPMQTSVISKLFWVCVCCILTQPNHLA